MQTFPLFQFLRWLLVVISGRGYNRSRWMNDVHHKLSYRLHRWKPIFGMRGIQKVPAPGMPTKFLNVRAEDGGVAHQLIVYREYEPFESSLVRTYLKPGMTVYNIGANIGYYALVASECVGASGKVIAFEPEPNNFELLQSNMEENGVKNVERIAAAVGSAEGTATLAISKTNSGDHQLQTVQGRTGITVPVLTLDTFVRSGHPVPEAIVMDVQGSELDVLRGASNMLASVKTIFLEFWPQGLNERHPDGAKKLLELLKFAGFSLSIIDERSKSLRKVTTDQLLASVTGAEEVNLLCTK